MSDDEAVMAELARASRTILAIGVVSGGAGLGVYWVLSRITHPGFAGFLGLVVAAGMGVLLAMRVSDVKEEIKNKSPTGAATAADPASASKPSASKGAPSETECVWVLKTGALCWGTLSSLPERDRDIIESYITVDEENFVPVTKGLPSSSDSSNRYVIELRDGKRLCAIRHSSWWDRMRGCHSSIFDHEYEVMRYAPIRLNKAEPFHPPAAPGPWVPTVAEDPRPIVRKWKSSPTRGCMVTLATGEQLWISGVAEVTGRILEHWRRITGWGPSHDDWAEMVDYTPLVTYPESCAIDSPWRGKLFLVEFDDGSRTAAYRAGVGWVTPGGRWYLDPEVRRDHLRRCFATRYALLTEQHITERKM